MAINCLRIAEVWLADGALPPEMCDFIQNKCAEEGKIVVTHWDFVENYEEDYNSMKEQLEKGIPVIWAVHDWDTANDGISNNGIKFYTYNDATGQYEYDKNNGNSPSSHYITVPAIYENEADPDHRRMVEISSWGKKYYVDYDEFEDWVENNGFNQPFSSITHTTVVGG